MVVELIEETDFKTFIEGHKIVIVDFFATWCGPCKQLAPVLEDLYKQYKDKGLAVLKVDVNKFEDLTDIHKIEGLPTLVVYKNGILTKYKFEGYTEKEEFEEMLSKEL